MASYIHFWTKAGGTPALQEWDYARALGLHYSRSGVGRQMSLRGLLNHDVWIFKQVSYEVSGITPQG
jgi:hypothetical protein